MPAGQPHVDITLVPLTDPKPRVRDHPATRMARQLRERFAAWATQVSLQKSTRPLSTPIPDDLIDPALRALSAGPIAAVASHAPARVQTSKPTEALLTALSRDPRFTSDSTYELAPSPARQTPIIAPTLQPASDALEDKMPAPVVPIMSSKASSIQPGSQVTAVDTAIPPNLKTFEFPGSNPSSLPSLLPTVYENNQLLPAYQNPILATEKNSTSTDSSCVTTKPLLNINQVVKEKTALCSDVGCTEAEPHSEHRFQFHCGVTGCTLDRRYSHQHDECSNTVAPTNTLKRSRRTSSISESNPARVFYPVYQHSSSSKPSTGPSHDANLSIPAIQEHANSGSVNPFRHYASATNTPTIDPDPPCSEHPHLFTGSDSLEALLSLADAPEPVHRGRARPCMNGAAHIFEPQYVCSGCIEQSSNNIKSTKPGLLAPKYLPLCETCARAAEAANGVTSHPSCKCGAGWLCHDCRILAHEIAQAKKEGEVEWRNGGITQAIMNSEEDIVGIAMKCRCGADIVAESARVSRCAGCEACRWNY